ncbi:alanine racemase [Deferribacteraceae bacterium V6Fe1]|nr:alanine racemase [Deferribacteraceae bacterium V6Fe1]
MVYSKKLRSTYAKIDLTRYSNNINYLKTIGNSAAIATLKANAYGHGAVPLGKYLLQNNTCDFFSVATISEGVTLRDNLGKEPRILILGYVDSLYFNDVVNNNLIMTIYDFDIADKYHSHLTKHSIKMPVALKIDTGMNRLGFDTDLDLNMFKEKYKNFDIFLTMTHLSSPDSDDNFTKRQLSEFDDYVKKYSIDNTSVLNSSAILKYENRYRYIRPGIASFGYAYGVNDSNLKPVMSIYSNIVHIKNIKKGDSISYNRRFIADKDMKVGVLPIGYADGYPRLFTNRAYVRINEFICQVVGAVCMDMIMIDLTNVPERFYSDEVELLGDNVSGYEWGKWAETIIYELLCKISDRIPRIYVSENGNNN